MPDSRAVRSYLELGALPGAVPCARLHTRQVLWEWDLGELSEAAELVVSELVTNALQTTVDRALPAPIRLWLSNDGVRVLIEVWDADPRPPRPKPLGIDDVLEPGDDSGRGLFLVASVSKRWSWYSHEWGGKVVWAEVTG
jgi:anti-sigma regulatory factor (Ser/Thr protein kinase)